MNRKIGEGSIRSWADVLDVAAETGVEALDLEGAEKDTKRFLVFYGQLLTRLSVEDPRRSTIMRMLMSVREFARHS